MDNLVSPLDQNVLNTSSKDNYTKIKLWFNWSKRKIIFIGVVIVMSTVIFWFLTNIQAGREANFWELAYSEISTHVTYADFCNKIYPGAYFTTGGGFSGEPLETLNLRDICLRHTSVHSIGGYVPYSTDAVNPLGYMGYSSQDIQGSESDFLNKVSNTEDFRSRIKKLPDFSQAKQATNGSTLVADPLQCGQYQTSYVAGLAGYNKPGVYEYEAERSPCCFDLNEDKVCDSAQWKKTEVSAEKVDILISLDGPGFLADPHPNTAYPDTIYAGYIIKDKPFNIKIKLVNKNTVATNPNDTYLSFGAYNPNTGGLSGLTDLTKYSIIPVPSLQPGQSMDFDINNITYQLDDNQTEINMGARLNVQQDIDHVDSEVGSIHDKGLNLFAFPSEKEAESFKNSYWH